MRIIKAYRTRTPSWAAAIAFLLGPEFGFYYLGFGWRGSAYLILSLVVILVLPLLLNTWLATGGIIISLGISLCYRIFGAVAAWQSAAFRHPRERYPWFSRFYVWVLLFWLAPLMLAQAVRSLMFQPFAIPAASMAPTLMVGDYAFADMLTYGISHYSLPSDGGPARRIGGRLPERGEVVVFRPSSGSDNDYVKRVIGLPGDRVQMRDGRLILNGVAVPRRKLGRSPTIEGVSGTEYEETLPEGAHYPVIDMRAHGPGDDTAEVTVPADHYFVLGDNRDNSLDSRFGLGFVPADNIYARMAVVVFNGQHPNRLWERVH